jgi:multiple sugar transport system permease protein
MLVDVRRIKAHPQEFLLRLLLYVVVLAGGIAFAIPFVWMVRTAIMPTWQIYTFPPEWIPAELHFENFREPFRVFPFARWYRNTAMLVVLNVFANLLTNSMAAFSLARLRYPGRDALFLVILAIMMVPYHVRLIPQYLLYARLGWINTMYPLWVPTFLADNSFSIFLLRQFFMTIPTEMDDAAAIDGCGIFSLYWRIALPLSLPALGVAAIYQFTWTVNNFMAPLIYLENIKLFPIALGLAFFKGRYYTRMAELMAATLMVITPMLILFFLAQRYFVQGIVMTGVKG